MSAADLIERALARTRAAGAAAADARLVQGDSVEARVRDTEIDFVKQAREQGARLVIVDPKRTKIAEQCDLFLQVQPGTDVVLALAMAAELERRGAHDRGFIERWVYGHDAYMAAARAHTPERVAEAIGAGRAARLAGRIPRLRYAQASSPETGMPDLR